MLNSQRKLLEIKVKNFVFKELNDAFDLTEKDYVLYARNRAFGVVFFACNELFDIYNEELANWWEEEILPQFNRIIARY